MPKKFRQGLHFHQQGNLVKAEHIYENILRDNPADFEALHLLGVIALQTGRTQRGLDLVKKAISLNSNVAAAHSNLGYGLISLKRFEDALRSYDKAIALKPDYAEAYFNRGNVLRELKRCDGEVLRNYDQAIALKPNYQEAYYNRGNALISLKRFEDALANFDKAIALRPDHAEAHNNRGICLHELKRPDDALTSYDRAIALQACYANAHNNRGHVLNAVGRPNDALASFEKAIELDPDHAEAHHNRGNTLRDAKQFESALVSYAKAIAIQPSGEFMYGDWLATKLRICDWSDLEGQVASLVERVRLGEKVSTPFPLLGISHSADLLRKAAEIWVHAKHPPLNTLPKFKQRARHEKIRVGYFSSDFRYHALSHLMAELFERHDRSCFEVTAYSFAPPSPDAMQQRLRAAFDQFTDVRHLLDEEVALLARNAEIDIAVDLNGFTADSRTNIFAMRAAPIQVSYLGYAGTMGADYIDYLIADETIVPGHQRQHYTEKIVFLPNTFMVRDTKHAPPTDQTLNRTEAGLPQDGFVFCCFNNPQKVMPAVFDAWMTILTRVPGSVLWLLEDNAKAASNLRKEAGSRGVDASRLVFAKRVPAQVHLARHRLADLFLDTSPFNAHTTASDALWMGLPVLTHIGETFAGRVAASLLVGAQLPELIVSTLEGYVSLAVEFATDSARLGVVKRNLERNRLATDVFNTARFTRHLEAAYATMVERYHADQPLNCIGGLNS